MLNPHLPEASPDLGPYHTRQHRANGGCNFHRACLELSQSLWLQEKPAQAILQLNKASMIPEQAAPYPALVWFLAHRKNHLFIGNPVRHFQHLASRMSGDHSNFAAGEPGLVFIWPKFHYRGLTSPVISNKLIRNSSKFPFLGISKKNYLLVTHQPCLSLKLSLKTRPSRAHSSTG